MTPHRFALFVLCLSISLLTVATAEGQRKGDAGQKRQSRQREDSQQRAESLRAICERLKVGDGAVIADIGAGNGRDTWTFAGVVGETGKVFSEEIEQGKCTGIDKAAKEKDLPQVQAVLGTPTSPELPAKSVDMAFMHHVYHHVSKPQEMLHGIWNSLKPGGYFVIVDQQLGTLTNWVDREERANKHFWIAETTVVREARENGFAFVDFVEPLWHAKGSFVLIFQRPTTAEAPGSDPDVMPRVPRIIASELLTKSNNSYDRVAFVALGRGRAILAPLMKKLDCEAVDIVLEEWATRKDERPESPAGLEIPSVLTEKGDPKLGPESIDAVYFLDTYHLLFHGPTLLKQLGERLTKDGQIYVLDRKASKEMSHREASHRRMIPPALVKEEMKKAGFILQYENNNPLGDRFLLVFGKAE